uniref:Uncharacterized protein n=1 Tax=Lotharella globosa TaxID=91324 RepID=A0A7S4DYM3_9EUKA
MAARIANYAHRFDDRAKDRARRMELKGLLSEPGADPKRDKLGKARKKLRAAARFGDLRSLKRNLEPANPGTTGSTTGNTKSLVETRDNSGRTLRHALACGPPGRKATTARDAHL